MHSALLLIDIQNDYFPGGAMQLEGSRDAGQRAAVLLAAFRGKGLPVIHVQHDSLDFLYGFSSRKMPARDIAIGLERVTSLLMGAVSDVEDTGGLPRATHARRRYPFDRKPLP